MTHQQINTLKLPKFSCWFVRLRTSWQQCKVWHTEIRNRWNSISHYHRTYKLRDLKLQSQGRHINTEKRLGHQSLQVQATYSSRPNERMLF